MALRLVIFASLLAPFVFAQNPSADAIAGIWETASGGYVQIYPTGDTYTGRIVGSTSSKPRYDRKNPDPDKQSRRLLGTIVLTGLQYDNEKTWHDGEIYDPDNGKNYSVKATLSADDTLTMRGYIGISLFGKSETWKPVPRNAPNVQLDFLHDANY